MTASPDEWTACKKAKAGDILRWNEPIWAAPNKPRGKPDKIGEQRVVAEVLNVGDFVELQVRSVERLNLDEGTTERLMKVKEGDHIRRKDSSLALGQCEKIKE